MSTLVLGIGNTIMSDDGFGPRVVDCLLTRFRFPPDVKVLDGGTLGLDLLPHLEGVENLLIVDAIDSGDPPGTVRRLVEDEVPAAFSSKLSPHQVGLQDLLAVATLQGHVPSRTVLWGVQPRSVEMGTSLSVAVEAMVGVVTEKVVEEIKSWGITGLAGRDC